MDPLPTEDVEADVEGVEVDVEVGVVAAAYCPNVAYDAVVLTLPMLEQK